MTKKAKKKIAKAPKTPPAPRRETRTNPGMGHNVTALREIGEPLVDEFLKLYEQMESDMAGYRSDINNLYEKAAGDLGLKKTVVSKELKRILARKKAEAKEKEMAPDERQQTELFRASMEGTPFGDWAAGTLAEPESNGNAAESDEEGSED